MILSRITAHIREQNWTAIGIDFVIVVFGVFVGLQVNLWNEARVEATQREQIVDALVTSLNDAIGVQERFVAEIDTGLSEWEAAFARGKKPPPYFYRIEGSDIAPDVWSTFERGPGRESSHVSSTRSVQTERSTYRPGRSCCGPCVAACASPGVGGAAIRRAHG